MALQGDRLVVGAYNETVGSDHWTGAAYIFTRSGSDWGAGARLAAPAADRSGIDYFGWDVAISDPYIAVGAPRTDVDGHSDCGAVYVFSRLGPGWIFNEQLTKPQLAGNDEIGESIAMANGLIVAGDTYSLQCISWRVDSGGWAPWAPFFADDGKPVTSQFGTGVALSDDGEYLVVGDPLDSGSGAGYAFTTDLNPATNCTGGLLDPVPLLEPGTVYFGCNDFTGTDGAACFSSNRDVWYRYTAPCDGILALSLCGTNDMGGQDSGIDTVLSVHTGCPGTVDNIVACNNTADSGNYPDACGILGDTGDHRDPAVKVGVTTGQSYRIRVASAGVASPAGLFVLHVDFTCCRVDWDGNGVVNSTDVSAFINDWFADQTNGTLFTDFDHNGVVNSTDVSNFINEWFAGCEF